MGVVYKAVRADDEFSKLVAMKIVQDSDPATVSRLRQERQILAGLEHPYIARLLDGGTTADGRPFLVMEFVDGLPIDRYVAERRLPLREIARTVPQDLFGGLLCASQPDRASRPEAGQHSGYGRRAAQTARFRHRQAAGRIGAAHQNRRGRHDAGIRQPRTGAWARPSRRPATCIRLGVLLYELLSGARPYRNTASALETGAGDPHGEPPRPLGSARRTAASTAISRTSCRWRLRKEPERRYAVRGSAGRRSSPVCRGLSGDGQARHARIPHRQVRRAGTKCRLRRLRWCCLALVGGIAATAWAGAHRQPTVQRCTPVGPCRSVRISRCHRGLCPAPRRYGRSW